MVNVITTVIRDNERLQRKQRVPMEKTNRLREDKRWFRRENKEIEKRDVRDDSDGENKEVERDER